MRYTNILWKEKRNLLYEIIERIIFIILLLHSRDSHSSNINKKKTNIFLQKTRALNLWLQKKARGKEQSLLKKKKKENIKYSSLAELFNVKNVLQMKNENIWFADSVWYIWKYVFQKRIV